MPLTQARKAKTRFQIFICRPGIHWRSSSVSLLAFLPLFFTWFTCFFWFGLLIRRSSDKLSPKTLSQTSVLFFFFLCCYFGPSPSTSSFSDLQPESYAPLPPPLWHGTASLWFFSPSLSFFSAALQKRINTARSESVARALWRHFLCFGEGHGANSKGLPAAQYSAHSSCPQSPRRQAKFHQRAPEMSGGEAPRFFSGAGRRLSPVMKL